ncbi:MAG: hypothetical protein GXO39_07810 [Thermotogae bacterium]|nr:hypothetical protein [Thermotogota bacterium]
MSRVKFAYFFAAVFMLLLGLHLALVRLGYDLPLRGISFNHAQIMVVGFLGTLIGLERAVAIRKAWTYTVPLFLFVGSFVGMIFREAHLVGAVGGFGMASIFGYLLYSYGHRPQWVVMGAGGILLALGEFFYALNFPLSYVTHFWILFLVLTIAGERLELSIMLIPKRGVLPTFYVPVALSIIGSIAGNDTLVGFSYILFALWLFYYDVATRNVRASGLVRFVAVSLLSGYLWLLLGGIGWVLGWNYDFRVHSLTLGFVFGMIFAHAPIIFPAILGFRIRFHPVLYFPVFLLNFSLLLRFLYDKPMGGLLGVIAVLLYFLAVRILVHFTRQTGI